MRHPKRRAAGVRVHREDYLTLEELGKELDAYSVAISTQVRTINLGILGLSWLMLLGDEKLAKLVDKLPHPALLGISLICLLALVSDLGQYLLAREAVDAAFDEAAKSEKRVAAYDMTSISYRGAFWCYRSKLVLTVLAAMALIASLCMLLFNAREESSVGAGSR